MTEQPYHLANIRDLLINGFDEQDLRALCHYVPEFSPVYQRLPDNASRVQIADALIEHCEKTLQIDALLAEAKKRNPTRYELHGPYYYKAPASSLQKKVLDPAKRLAAKITSIRLRRTGLPGCRLRSLLLFSALALLLVAAGVILWQLVLCRVVLQAQCEVEQCYFADFFLWRVNLHEAYLRGADLSGANLSGANLSGAHLAEADLFGANLSKADLHGADLSGANLLDADLNEADLHLATLDSNTQIEDKWRCVWQIVNYGNTTCLPAKPDLSWANLSGARLRAADLGGATLSSANLSKADLSLVNLAEASLGNANLIGADLSGANLYKATLLEADLSGAHLTGAHLEGATLLEADLSGAYLDGAYLNGAKVTEKQLSRAKSLAGATLPDGTKHE